MRKVVSSSLCGNRQKLHLRGSCAGGALCTAGGRRCRSCHRAAARRPPRPHRTRSTCMATRSMSVTFAGAPVHQALRHNCSAGDLPLGSITVTTLPLPVNTHSQVTMPKQTSHSSSTITCSGHCRGGPEKEAICGLWHVLGTHQAQAARGSNRLAKCHKSITCLRPLHRPQQQPP